MKVYLVMFSQLKQPAIDSIWFNDQNALNRMNELNKKYPYSRHYLTELITADEPQTVEGIKELYENTPELNKLMTQEEFDKARQASIDLDGYDMSALLTPAPPLDQIIKKDLEREQVQYLIDTFESQCQNYWNKDIKHRLIELNEDLTEDNEIMNLESLNLFIKFANIYPHIRPNVMIDPDSRIMIDIKDIDAEYTIVFMDENAIDYAVFPKTVNGFQDSSTFDETIKFLSSYSNIFTVKE